MVNETTIAMRHNTDSRNRNYAENSCDAITSKLLVVLFILNLYVVDFYFSAQKTKFNAQNHTRNSSNNIGSGSNSISSITSTNERTNEVNAKKKHENDDMEYE